MLKIHIDHTNCIHIVEFIVAGLIPSYAAFSMWNILKGSYILLSNNHNDYVSQTPVK